MAEWVQLHYISTERDNRKLTYANTSPAFAQNTAYFHIKSRFFPLVFIRNQRRFQTNGGEIFQKERAKRNHLRIGNETSSGARETG
jgi:hypothetical protein